MRQLRSRPDRSLVPCRGGQDRQEGALCCSATDWQYRMLTLYAPTGHQEPGQAQQEVNAELRSCIEDWLKVLGALGRDGGRIRTLTERMRWHDLLASHFRVSVRRDSFESLTTREANTEVRGQVQVLTALRLLCSRLISSLPS